MSTFFQSPVAPTRMAPWKKATVVTFAMTGFISNLVEIICYVDLFRYIYNHNKMAIGLLDMSTIKRRNQVNAVSLIGLFGGWLLEVWYILFVIILFLLFEASWVHEMVAIVKYYEFYFIPLIQIQTSAPIMGFIDKTK